MPDHDDPQKKPQPFDPPNLFPGQDGLSPDPTRIPGTGWKFQPQFSPGMDPPSPYAPRTPQPQVPGGDPPSPNWWSGMFDGPQKPGPAPENPFTPEAQQKIKEKEEQRRRELEARKQLEEMAKQKPKEDKGDFPLPQGDTRTA